MPTLTRCMHDASPRRVPSRDSLRSFSSAPPAASKAVANTCTAIATRETGGEGVNKGEGKSYRERDETSHSFGSPRQAYTQDSCCFWCCFVTSQPASPSALSLRSKTCRGVCVSLSLSLSLYFSLSLSLSLCACVGMHPSTFLYCVHKCIAHYSPQNPPPARTHTPGAWCWRSFVTAL